MKNNVRNVLALLVISLISIIVTVVLILIPTQIVTFEWVLLILPVLSFVVVIINTSCMC